MEIEALLAPLAGPDPCGENLEYDAAFAELERISQGKPEQQIGSTVVAATEPEWRLVEKQATGLLERSKDLRVALQWARARLRSGGLPGFSEALTFIRGLVERYWEGVHPRLDPDDGNDPTMRVNVLLGLVTPDLLAALRTTPLVESRAVGRFSLKDIEVALGEAAGAGGQPAPSRAAIDAAVADMDVDALNQVTNAARSAAEAVAGIVAAVTEQVGAGRAPNFDALDKMLRKIQRFLAEAVASRQPAAQPAEPTNGTNGAGMAAVPGTPPRGPAFVGELTTRDDVLKALDHIISYYQRYEPSSPIPMFIERCKRLVRMSFLDIVRELVPDAMSQIEVLKGRQE